VKKIILFLIVVFILTGCVDTQNTEIIETVPSKDNQKITNAKSSHSNNQVSNNSKKLNINDVNSPILVKGYFLGGLSRGNWLNCEDFYNSKLINLDKYQYDVFKNGKYLGKAYGSMPIDPKTGEYLKEDKFVEDFCMIDLIDKANKNVDYDIAIKATWDLFPRGFKNQSLNQKIYYNLVKKHLEEAGVPNSKTNLKQVIRVDLEGDSTEEVLISADNTNDYEFEQVKKGDNAIILFRKIINGKVIDQVVEQDIRKEDEKEVSIFRYLFRIENFADLDGDGTMEVIIRHWYYEGESWGIYKLKDNKLVLIASNGFGV
jgi:hypothetical protein